MGNWIQPGRVRAAISALNKWRGSAKSQQAMHLWPLLALIEKKVNTETPVPFTEDDDRSFWDRYARMPGDMRDRKDVSAPGGFTENFYVEPLLASTKPSDYYHRSPATIRDRTFLNAWQAATYDVETHNWRLNSDYADIIVKKVLTKNGSVYRIPVVDLAAWLFRGQKFSDDASARRLEEKFRVVFPFDESSYQKLFEFRDEMASTLFTNIEPSDVDYGNAVKEILIPTGPIVNVVTSGNGTHPESVLNEDDFLLTEVKKLMAIGTSGIILRGCPGTGKTWYAKQIARHLVKSPSHIFAVQFHPSFGYEDFVEGFRPDDKAKSGFKIVSKIFTRACETASALPQKTPVVFIIDEINRGDPARIFGELLTYIEYGYRGQSFNLTYTDRSMGVPSNLLLLGTMNPHDRSITQLDGALVRRFDHIDIEPSSDAVQDFLEASNGFRSEQIDRIVKWFEALQRRAMLPHGIGHTYFKDVNSPERLQTVWQYRMLPYCEAVLELEAEKLERVKSSFDGMFAAIVGRPGAGE